MTNAAPSGVFCAALTPLGPDLSPDAPAFIAHCRRLIAQGCDGIALLGTTGEANSFSLAERMALLEATVAGGIAPDRLMPGTGVAALTETVALTKHALTVGVETVVMLPPFYYKGVSDDGLFASYAEVVERVGDPRLKVVLYHIPQMSAVPLSGGLIARLRERFPGTFVGIKDSSGDFANMTGLIARFPGFAVLAGADPLLQPLLRAGGAGCITATSNLCARELATVYRHGGDPTRESEVTAAQARIIAMRELSQRVSQISALRALLAHATGEPIWLTPRPPLLPLDAPQRAELIAVFDALDADRPPPR